ncbi:MAG TPA: DUF1885 family protein [Bacillales bacterium]|nr:DUF1885 family protein [Bacillales bacterium]
MTEHAYIKLVPASEKQEMNLDDVKDLLRYYRDITSKTGQQLEWNYGGAAFPYEFAEPRESRGKWFYLRATDTDNYCYIVFAVDSEKTEDGDSRFYVQVTLPDDATQADKSKANEFCKFIAKKLKGELHLFNGRIMYFYKQKA